MASHAISQVHSMNFTHFRMLSEHPSPLCYLSGLLHYIHSQTTTALRSNLVNWSSCFAAATKLRLTRVRAGYSAMSTGRPRGPSLPSPQRLAASHFQQNTILKSLRSVEQGLRARLRSIDYDAEQVLHVYQRLFPNHGKSLPLYGNARAGSWYVPPFVNHVKTRTCSFKSADGHYGQWSSSLRRPNIHVLVDCLEYGGVVVVDVTRRGKKWPDSFTKTIPIWCAVVNIVTGLVKCRCEQNVTLASKTQCATCAPLHLHPDVPDSEKEQIAARLLRWVEDWQRSSLSLNQILPKLSHAIKSNKPLRPLWVNCKSRLWEDGFPLEDLPFTPIICLSASKVVKQGDRSFVEPRTTSETVCGVNFAKCKSGFPYVQGAGDDEEAWSLGLTPFLMWENRESLIQIADIASESSTAGEVEEHLRCKISALLAENLASPPKESGPTAMALKIWNSRLLLMNGAHRENIGKLVKQARTTFHTVIVLGETCPPEMEGADQSEKQQGEGPGQKVVAWFPLRNNKGKVDHKYGFGRALGPCLTILRRSCVDEKKRALLCCTAKHGDWSAGLAIAWLAWHCELRLERSGEAEGNQPQSYEYKVVEERKTEVEEISKADINSVMLHFMSAYPQFQLSRSTLKQLNRFFSSPQPSSTLLDE